MRRTLKPKETKTKGMFSKKELGDVFAEDRSS
jgi:hypothetical protein